MYQCLEKCTSVLRNHSLSLPDSSERPSANAVIKERIEKTQQNSRCGDRDETTNHILSEWGKLAQKENNTIHDLVRKVIRWEKKLEIEYTKKGYMQSPEPVLEKEMHKLPWDFERQTDHIISARRPDLITISKNKSEHAELWTLLSHLTTERKEG